MTQTVVIVLLVAIFRGIVWVVQRVQENAKARAEAASRTGPVDATQVPVDAAQQRSAGADASREVPVQSEQRVRRSEGVREPALRRGTQSKGSKGPRARGGRPGDKAPDARVTRQGAERRPVPAMPAGAARTQSGSARSDRVAEAPGRRGVLVGLRSAGGLRNAVLASEILGPPRGW